MMDWLTTLTLDDCERLLTLARATAGPLSADEARAVLTFASEGRTLGYGFPAIRWALRTPAELQQIIGRTVQPKQRTTTGSRALATALEVGAA